MEKRKKQTKKNTLITHQSSAIQMSCEWWDETLYYIYIYTFKSPTTARAINVFLVEKKNIQQIHWRTATSHIHTIHSVWCVPCPTREFRFWHRIARNELNDNRIHDTRSYQIKKILNKKRNIFFHVNSQIFLFFVLLFIDFKVSFFWVFYVVKLTCF